MTIFAANGYFVLQVNFRSSTGYGEKFLWATWGAWGTKDGQDVMAGVDYVIKRFPVSAIRVTPLFTLCCNATLVYYAIWYYVLGIGRGRKDRMLATAYGEQWK